jgi:hypothetical protein
VRLAIRLLAIFASLGGPLYIFDLVKGDLGTTTAFALCFAPIGLIVLGSLAFEDSPFDALARVSIRLGQLGMWALFGMNVYTFVQLVTGHAPPDLRVTVFGIVVGSLACAAYSVRAHRFFIRRTP